MIAIGNFTRSSSFRVGVLLTSLALVAILFTIYFWRLASSNVFVDEANAAVDAEVYALTTLYDKLGIDVVSDAITQRISNDHQASEKTRIALIDSKTSMIAGNMSAWPASVKLPSVAVSETSGIVAVALPGSGEHSTQASNLQSSPYNVTYQTVLLGEHALFVGRNIDDISSAQWLGKTFSWVIIILLCVLGFISFAVAFYVVNRINRMSQTADSIIRTGNLEARLAIDSNWDDLSRLSVVFNLMLDTIEGAVDNIKSVSDSIAHDLRTPLARLRATLERIDDQQLRQETTHEADNLLNMFNSLLRISRIETTQKKEGFCAIQLEQLAGDVVDLYLPLAEERNINLVCQLAPVTLHSDPNLLFQAIANVLDNAIKYAPNHGMVTLQLLATKHCYVVMVNDNGSGVGEHELTSLEQRFYRSDRSRSDGGNGLGLSLVSAIVKLHDGKLWFVHDPLMQGHGLGVVFTFPR